MPKRASNARDVILGLLFFGGLFGLAVVTTQLTNFPLSGGRYYVSILFEDVYGIQREDKVLVHGTRYGRVRRVDPIATENWAKTGRNLAKEGLVPTGRDFTPNVLLVLELEFPVELKNGYQIFAEDSNLLGGKVVSILPGSPDAVAIAIPDDSGSLQANEPADLKQIALVGMPKPHPITAIGKLVENNLEDLDSFVDNLLNASEKLSDPKAGLIGYALNDPDAIAKVDDILAQISALTDLTNRDDNLLSDILKPSVFRTDLLASADNVKAFTEGLNNSESLVGGLITTNSPMKRRIDTILTDGQEFMTKLNRDDSLVGKALATGPGSLGAKIDGTMDNISSASNNISNAASRVSTWVDKATTNPESLLYQIAEGDLGTSVRNAIDGIDRAVSGFNQYIIDPIAANDSLAGLVFNDPDMRKKVERMVTATLGIIEDAREAAPVTSLGSFIFGGF